MSIRYSVIEFDGSLLTNLFFNSMGSVPTTEEPLSIFRGLPFFFVTTGEVFLAFGTCFGMA